MPVAPTWQIGGQCAYVSHIDRHGKASEPHQCRNLCAPHRRYCARHGAHEVRRDPALKRVPKAV